MWNNTYVFDANTSKCYSSNSSLACAGSCGGFFDEAASRTFLQSLDSRAAGASWESFPNHKNDTFGTDTLDVNSSLSLPSFPIGVNSEDGDLFNSLGLGRNSTFLNAMVAKKVISSRTYSFWQGWTGSSANHQLDGSLTFGGYDAAKIADKNITLAMTDDVDCLPGTLVYITAITLGFPNGTTASIMGPSRANTMRACISAPYPIMSLPADIWDAFVNATGVVLPVDGIGRSGGINFLGMRISAADA